MKIKLFGKSGAAESAASNTPAQTPIQETAPTPTSSAVPKISFKRKDTGTPITESAPALPISAPTPNDSQPAKKKPGRKPKTEAADGETPVKAKPGRKRKAAEDGAEDTPSAKKPRPAPIRLQLNTTYPAKPPPGAPGSATSVNRIKLKQSKPEPTPTIGKVRIKHVGEVPRRPVGVGYDSEDEDAEDDPAIEHQVVLRFPPNNPDCEYLARMITDKKIGVKVSDGGADVSFTFLDKDARRSLWNIRGNKYAGALFDLPTITEVFKTWNKKDIMKVTDISQILMILGRVETEQDAKEYPLPKEVDRERWEYPHGLTPPLKWVRKRRFRKRTNFRDIDEIERKVQELLARDKECIDAGGTIEYDYVDENAPNELQAGVDAQVDEVDMDAEGEEYEYEDEMDAQGDVEPEDDDPDAAAADFMAELEEGLAAGDDPMMDLASAAPTIESAALHAMAQQGGSSAAETPSASSAPTPSAGEASANDDDYADEDDEGDEEEEELTDEQKAALDERAQQMEEFESLKQQLVEAKQAAANTTNPMLRARNQKKVDQLQNEVDLKRAALGIDEDDE